MVFNVWPQAGSSAKHVCCWLSPNIKNWHHNLTSQHQTRDTLLSVDYKGQGTYSAQECIPKYVKGKYPKDGFLCFLKSLPKKEKNAMGKKHERKILALPQCKLPLQQDLRTELGLGPFIIS